MPPKQTESERFKQAAVDGKTAALSEKNSRETAAPEVDAPAFTAAKDMSDYPKLGDKSEKPFADVVHGRTEALTDEELGIKNEKFQTPYGSGGKQPYGSGEKQPYGSGEKQPYGSGEKQPYGSGEGIVGKPYGSGIDEILNAFEARMATQMQVQMATQMQIQTDILKTMQTMQSMLAMFIQQQVGTETPTKVNTLPDIFAPCKLDFKKEPTKKPENVMKEEERRKPSPIDEPTSKEGLVKLTEDRPTEDSTKPTEEQKKNPVVRQVKNHKNLLKIIPIQLLRLVPTYEGKSTNSHLQFIDTFELHLKNDAKKARWKWKKFTVVCRSGYYLRGNVENTSRIRHQAKR